MKTALMIVKNTSHDNMRSVVLSPLFVPVITRVVFSVTSPPCMQCGRKTRIMRRGGPKTTRSGLVGWDTTRPKGQVDGHRRRITNPILFPHVNEKNQIFIKIRICERQAVHANRDPDRAK